MALETTPWNIQDHLRTPEDRAAFLEAAFAEAPEDAAYPAEPWARWPVRVTT